ncbi:hypothetical protein WN943_003345 [Citrus x changshan-huyou]
MSKVEIEDEVEVVVMDDVEISTTTPIMEKGDSSTKGRVEAIQNRGASNNMSENRSMFMKINETANSNVAFGDNSEVPLKGRGKRRAKLDDKSEKFIIIGYDNSKGYKMYNPNNIRIVINRDLPSSKNSSRDLQTELSVTTSASRMPVPPAVNCRTTDPLPPFERQSKPLPRHSRTVHRVLHQRRQLKPPAASTTRHHAAWIARSNPAVCSSSTPLQRWPWRKHCLVNNWQDAYKGMGCLG